MHEIHHGFLHHKDLNLLNVQIFQKLFPFEHPNDINKFINNLLTLSTDKIIRSSANSILEFTANIFTHILKKIYILYCTNIFIQKDFFHRGLLITKLILFA